MGKINLLDENLVNKIAAGEVIERPASVIKELIENSLDAGADTISIEISKAGTEHIRITDNGEGMTEEDAKLACERHATSKIKKTDDLFSITSLGFRGEALASISAVSKLKISTRTADSIEGTQISIDGGKKMKVTPVGCPKGTDIIIDNLFFNTPARKKYLNTLTTELNHIIDVVQRFAIIRNDVSFKVIHNGKEIIKSPKQGDMKSKILDIYGMETARDMIPVKGEKDGILVTGYVSKPNNTKGSRSHQSLYLNKRQIRNKTISDAINEAYHTLMMIGRHPLAFLNIEIDPKTVDVNVHPAKHEVKFQDDLKIYSAVLSAVKQALESESLVPDIRENDFHQQILTPSQKKELIGNKPSKKPAEAHRKYSIGKGKQSVLESSKGASYGGMRPKSAIMQKDVISSDNHDVGTDSPTPAIDVAKEAKVNYRILGQVHMNYIVIEVESGIFVIDQHAAHERVLYEKFMKESSEKGIEVQSLVSPKRITLTLKESNVVNENLDLLKNLGFEMEPFGEKEFQLRSIPVLFRKEMDDNMLSDMITELTENNKAKSLDDKKERMIITMACKGAIKQGKPMEDAETHRLIDELMQTQNPYSCPHGRPVLVSMTIYELEKKFKRVQ